MEMHQRKVFKFLSQMVPISQNIAKYSSVAQEIFILGCNMVSLGSSTLETPTQIPSPA
jgi:hypothetical protein